MTSALFIAGLAAIVLGLSLIYVPLGLIVGGVFTATLAVLMHAGLTVQRRRDGDG
jgi:hypothetical protein